MIRSIDLEVASSASSEEMLAAVADLDRLTDPKVRASLVRSPGDGHNIWTVVDRLCGVPFAFASEQRIDAEAGTVDYRCQPSRKLRLWTRYTVTTELGDDRVRVHERTELTGSALMVRFSARVARSAHERHLAALPGVTLTAIGP